MTSSNPNEILIGNISKGGGSFSSIEGYNHLTTKIGHKEYSFRGWRGLFNIDLYVSFDSEEGQKIKSMIESGVSDQIMSEYCNCLIIENLPPKRILRIILAIDRNRYDQGVRDGTEQLRDSLKDLLKI